MRTTPRVAVTGMGVVSAAGLGVEPLWSCVLEGRALAREGLVRIDETIEAEMTGHRDARPPSKRFEKFAWRAATDALRQAGALPLTESDGLILGTTTGNLLEWEDGVIAAGRSGDVDSALRAHEPLARALDGVRAALDHRGPARLVSTACSSSTQAIALGAAWVRSGRVRRCLVGGAEVLSRLTVEGFGCLQLLSPEPAMPFDLRRGGINLAEGAAFLCLEREGARPALGFLSGWGMTSDAHHMTAPHPEGRGCFEAMRAALAVAGLEPAGIGWVHAHGTGSPANDLSECLAIERLFGSDGALATSTKGCHGHALGASGAIETALVLRALADGRVPATCGLVTPDPKLRVRHPAAGERCPATHVMKNSLGFGGANASLVLTRADAGPTPGSDS